MNKRRGFTLVEMLLAVFIFGFMSMSLATITATANRNMFQNYRRNTIKGNADFSMKVLQNRLTQATKIDSPAFGAASNQLALAENVDQASNCYPILPGGTAAWHYFCVAPDNVDATVSALYYHTGVLPAGSACGTAAPSTWNGPYPAFCGFGGGGTVTILMKSVAAPLPPASPFMFSRRATDGINERDNLKVMIRSFWSATARGFGANQRDIDFSLSTVVKINRSAW